MDQDELIILYKFTIFSAIYQLKQDNKNIRKAEFEK